MAAVGMMSYPVRDNFPAYPQQYAMYHQSRAHHPQTDATQSINVNPYANFARQAQPQPQPQEYHPQQQMQSQQRPPQQPASPTSEDGTRPSLPSISNLLGIADGDRPGQDAASQQALLQAQQQQAQQQSQLQQQSAQLAPPEPRHYVTQELPINPRSQIPPTPPLRNDSVVEGTHSPSTISTGSSLSAQPYFMASALNNVEAADQRVAAANLLKRHSLPAGVNNSPYGSTFSQSPYNHSPGSISNPSYYSPADPAYTSSAAAAAAVHAGIYAQRPLPSNFPPHQHHQSHQSQPQLPISASSTPNMPNTNPWEHHHYISASSQATYPQSQDRYICSTCNKAFSRPSSLKIHSHSHTGEKPFKCPHSGCGKAFSVRSNMKRHERGCHTGQGHANGHGGHLGGMGGMM